MNKKIFVIGLGKMGLGFCLNALKNGYCVLGYDPNLTQQALATEKGVEVAPSLEALIKSSPSPRKILLSVPAGAINDQLIQTLGPILSPHDLVIDTANAFYQNSIKNAQYLKALEIDYLDAGTSGGPSGAEHGSCMMVGGELPVFEANKTIFADLCLPDAYLYVGLSGAGHFTKMVHNGIEYGMMQAIAEGFQILNESVYQFPLEKLAEIANLWNQGSVIRSWLVELCQQVFADPESFETLKGVVSATGEGLWTVQTALEQGTPAPVIAAALMVRQTSQKQDLFANKTLAKLRQLFGGHAVKIKD